jgi:hypothetical protein
MTKASRIFSALSRFAVLGQRGSTRGDRKVGGECAAGVRRPVHRSYSALQGDRNRRGRQGWLTNGAAKLHEILDSYGIANTFEVHPGTHTSAVADVFRTTFYRY